MKTQIKGINSYYIFNRMIPSIEMTIKGETTTIVSNMYRESFFQSFFFGVSLHGVMNISLPS